MTSHGKYTYRYRPRTTSGNRVHRTQIEGIQKTRRSKDNVRIH